jgi:hypothetical protein
MIAGLALAAALAFQLSAAQRAVDFLSRETPRWFRENHCFSCHNNGDAARALYAASERGYRVPTAALADTTKWLLAPGDWESNRENPGFGDKKLACIQFAAALRQAYDSGVIRDREALRQAAASLLAYQEEDGSWQADAGSSAASPVTYGTALATYMARRTLESADRAAFAEPIARANGWLLKARPGSVVDAAALLMASPDRRDCHDLLLAAQSSDGGWGPHRMSPAEVFDTAIALLALRGAGEPVARGRRFLAARQDADGGWPPTTRPSGGQSYAQRISTSAWAALALVLTDPKR